MPIRRRALAAIAIVAVATLLGACAAMPGREPVQVSVVGIEPLQGEGMELRFNVKLRVQNPNDAPIEFDGLFVELDVQGTTLATGVSDAKGTIPRFGESLLIVPVSVSALRAVRQIIGVAASGAMPQKIDYELRGKIGGPLFNSVRFEHRGEMVLPG